MEIDFTFSTITLGIIKLFVLMLIGFGLRLKGFINDKFTDMMSLLLIRVLFPALILTKTIEHFDFGEFPYWWTLPLAAILFAIGGMVIGQFIHGILKLPGSRKEFISSCGFQNCGYLPMTLILFSFTGLARDRLFIYLFLFIMGFNLLMWSLVPLFLTGSIRKEFKWKILLNPPVVATLVSLIWVALLGRGSMPGVIGHPLSQLGQASFPLAMLMLGSYLCRYRAYLPTNKSSVVTAAIVKLLVFPAIILGIVYFIPINMDFKLFLFLQAIMPTAVSLVIIGSYTEADNDFFSSIIFYTHLAAIFTIPIWLAVFRAII
ncbi:AEC family transporter [Candidatus Omnitrophota bacterium]